MKSKKDQTLEMLYLDEDGLCLLGVAAGLLLYGCILPQTHNCKVQDFPLNIPH